MDSALPRVHSRKATLVKIFRSILLVVALSVGVCCAQAPAPEVKEVRGFDVASCAPSGFIAAHIEISKDALTVLKAVPGPGTIEIISPPNVYKFTTEDKDGKHYVSGKFEIVVDHIDKKGILIGDLRIEGKLTAMFYGIESDGSDATLLENANTEHDACKAFLEEQDEKPSEPEPSENSLPTDSGISKT